MLKLTSTGRSANAADLYALYPFLPPGSITATSINATLTPDQVATLTNDGVVQAASGFPVTLLLGAAALAFIFLR